MYRVRHLPGYLFLEGDCFRNLLVIEMWHFPVVNNVNISLLCDSHPILPRILVSKEMTDSVIRTHCYATSLRPTRFLLRLWHPLLDHYRHSLIIHDHVYGIHCGGEGLFEPSFTCNIFF